MEEGCLSLRYIVSGIVNGFARGGGVNLGSGEPKEQTAPDFYPQQLQTEKVRKPPFPTQGLALTLRHIGPRSLRGLPIQSLYFIQLWGLTFG